ncbi:recombinase RecA [Alteromonas sp. BL110]|uniref:recombinase RecA n=1 Tax=Alteromonas sp. BL110 TaxID=1714845 RepID=UPI000E53D2C0|nr:recombinase RecA [Alteromonas sp. BL110]AXT38499.1 recombinase RecA [Alteromonas sp. BL110]RKM83756.1 recombinase RecA [Alteromonas sp. BL110]
MKKTLSTLNNHPHIWRARDQKQSETKFSLGFSCLDKALNGGVASTGLVRISSLTGVGELSLFKRVICQHRTHKLVVFINPPGLLQSPWLENLGLKAQQVLVVKTSAAQEALWAAEQCLKSTACHCVVLWSDAVNQKEARRLQVAATHNDALCLLYTPPQHQLSQTSSHTPSQNDNSLPITLDIALLGKPHAVSVNIRKQRHGWPKDNIVISHRWTPDNHAIKWAMAHNTLSDQALHSVN